MQAINRCAPNPLFVATILGGFLTGLPALVTGWGDGSGDQVRWVIAGVVLSLSSFAVTVVCNVPRNDALAAVEAGSAAGDVLWADYVVSWTRWNIVRTVTSAASVVAYALSLRGR